MHSSVIRGADFKIEWRGKDVPHAEFFSSVRDTDRVGVVSPNRLEAIGASTLIMSYVTAFYDRYRERGSEFYAYPDFFTFQRETPCANYCEFDIWPEHKNIQIPPNAQQTAEAITERGVTILLVPDNDVRENEIEPVELESIRRNVRRCFAYSDTGTTSSSDLTIECTSVLLRDFALSVLDSLPPDKAVQKKRQQWEKRMAANTLRHTFRQLDLGEALRRI